MRQYVSEKAGLKRPWLLRERGISVSARVCDPQSCGPCEEAT